MKLHRNDPWVIHFQKTSKIEFREELWLPWQPKEKTLKIFLSQTVRAKAFIFGMQHHLVALYQNTSNYGPGVEISPMLWVTWISHSFKEGNF